MCLIVVKTPQSRWTAEAFERLEDGFRWNNDGAGFCYVQGGQVQIVKGLMTYEDLINALADHEAFDREDLVIHLRVATHGARGPANTHPFPLTSNVDLLRATKVATQTAIAHNGMLPLTSKHGLSDTQLFIKRYLTPLGGVATNPRVLDLLRFTDSKFAVMTPERVLTVGEYEKVDGWLYSNRSYDYKARWVGLDECDLCGDKGLTHYDTGTTLFLCGPCGDWGAV